MTTRYFGTDGIRAATDSPLLERPFVLRVGAALGTYLRNRYGSGPLHAVIGRDTRASGEAIALWLMEGLATADVRAFDAQTVPTPAVAKAVCDLELNLGIAVTASHNPASDNGIKLFTRGGLKFAPEEEEEIERLIDAAGPIEVEQAPSAYVYDARRHYRQFVESLLPENALVGWTLALDCAHGATALVTPDVLRGFGARVYAIGDRPNGSNINDGVGSEHTHELRQLVATSDARIGIAHDGDGDRLVLVDEDGGQVDGDAVLALIATHLLRRGELRHNTVVSTVMSNLAFDRLISEAGGHVIRAAVGDRNVLQAMLAGDYVLGGEASGHLILRDLLPTGDGLISALMVLRIMIETGQSLSEMVAAYKPFPQRLESLRIEEKVPMADIPGFLDEIHALESVLGSRGRILVRYSGTEPKIRLLVEAESGELVEKTYSELHDLVARSLRLIS